MFHLNDHLSRFDVWVVEDLVKIIDRATTDFLLLQFLEPPCRRLLLGNFVEDRSDMVAVGDTGRVGLEPVVF